ncbi:MAG: Flagellin [Pseudomonadota bacterium]|jgi:flagellin-like hook-associated protein FlgL
MAVINTNIVSSWAMASLGQVARESFKNTQRLSTGSAINSAADNASGLSITHQMTSQIRGLDVAWRNIGDGLVLGAQLSRLTHAGDNVSTMRISQTASRSRILDSDYAKEASDLVRLRIIQDAATSELAQDYVNQRSVLDLLK